MVCLTLHYLHVPLEGGSGTGMFGTQTSSCRAQRTVVWGHPSTFISTRAPQKFRLLRHKFSAELTSLSDLILRKTCYISGFHGRNATSFTDSDSPLANSKGLSMKCSSKNVFAYYRMSQADAE